MEAEISEKDLKKFTQKYYGNPANTLAEEQIRKLGILKANQRDQKYRFRFNVKVPDVKIYNQYDSQQCNIYAFLRVVKDIMRQNPQLKAANLDLSANYINFYDKFEKINTLYNELIRDSRLTPEKIREKVDFYIGSFGTFHFCREIVNKYGLVPAQMMPEVGRNYNDNLAIELLRDKIKADATTLIGMDDKAKRLKKKSELMYQAFQFLAKIFGVPPTSFEFRGVTYTPQDFKEQFLRDKLDDFTTVTLFDKDALLESQAYLPNIYLNDTEVILHLTPEKAKDAIVKQLIGGISVWFSAETSTAASHNEGVLDDKLYDFSEIFKLKKLPTEQRLTLGMINYDHAMCITGALIEKDQVRQFRVDDSFGESGKYGGQMIMTNSYLENCVVTLVLEKKFLV